MLKEKKQQQSTLYVAKATRWSEFKVPGTWLRPPGEVNSKHQVRGQGHVKMFEEKKQQQLSTLYLAKATRWNAPGTWPRPCKERQKRSRKRSSNKINYEAHINSYVAKATRWSEFKAPGTWPRPPGGVNSRHQVRGQGHVKRDNTLNTHLVLETFTALHHTRD